VGKLFFSLEINCANALGIEERHTYTRIEMIRIAYFLSIFSLGRKNPRIIVK